MTRTLQILSLAVLMSLALGHCLAKDAAGQQPAASVVDKPTSGSSLGSKLLPKVRSARSIGDMFEKMKNKLFGRKQASSPGATAGAAAASQQQAVQSVAPSSGARPQQSQQPQWDLSAINQQYNPYSVLGSNYQWPSSPATGANQPYLGQYSPIQGFAGSSFSDPSAASIISSMGMSPSATGQQPQQQLALASGSQNGASQSNGGILSSASQLIAQYLSPSSGASSQSAASGVQSSVQSGQQNGQQQQQQPPLSPQQSQYNEFASLMDAMVAQTGVSSQRQPTQYLGGQQQQQQQQQQQVANSPQSQQQQGYGLMQSQPAVGDQDMSGSSSVQSYAPAASAQPASQKSSMVSLAEQLAPGANFNKLVSFPFSLSSNDDTSKEGRYKLHIPFLNTHVKRSDQQAAVTSQRQQQQYINSYLSQQQQQYAANQVAQQQLAAQASQIVPTIVSPQSQSQSVSQQGSPVASGSSVQQSAGSQSSAAAVAAPASSSSISQSPSQSVQASQSNPSASSSVSASQSNSRPSWSIADVQSGSSSSKLIPMPSVSSASSSSSSSSSSAAAADEDSALASQRN